ncbi:hypothetical protein CTI12_AA089520 [Artemisia annua]|uniref:Phospholipase-like protein n=1 Tax=Artemisia annua TaxID=35608 RepID=A0A2U1Q0A2_ARTAN|nr:hypothetical protein CTI12_AA089520 [Artemisia annua]
MASKLSWTSVYQLEIELKEAGMKLLHTPSTSAEIVNILQINQLLDRVDQSPSASMIKALDPIIEALVAKELLGHPLLYVNISVSCCICEILRIMAPNAPYSSRQLEITSPLCWKLGKRVLLKSAAKVQQHLPFPDYVMKFIETIPATNHTSTLRAYASRKRKYSETLELRKVSSPHCGLICVKGYKVKQSVAPILEAIFKKHGDIASECVFKTVSVRQSILEVVCEVVKQLQINFFSATTIISELGEIECKVSDLEAANINVSWLRSHMENIREWDKSKKQPALLMEKKTNITLFKKEAEKDLRERNLELVKAKHLCEEAEKRVKVVYAVERKLDNDILESKITSPLCWKLGKRVLLKSAAKVQQHLPFPDYVMKFIETIPATNHTSTLRAYASRKRKYSETLELRKVSSPHCGLICVKGYKVKQSVAPILEAIFKKHGDIASECVFKTVSVRQSILEVVCEVVKQLQINFFSATTIISELGEIECKVSDLEAANINVSWIRSHMENIREWDKSKKQPALLMEKKTNITLFKKEAEKDLRERNLELVKAKHLCEEAEKRVKVVYAVERKLDNDILESKMYYNISEEVINCSNLFLKNTTKNFLVGLLWNSELENKYSKPMPLIGIYITVASLFCILAMVADLIHGLRNRKLWFPCKTFTLDAASLIVITVAMKLPVDLSNPMRGFADQIAKIGSMAFMCTMMANFLPSLATMNSKELLTNIIALDILVITLIVNACIQIYTGVIGDQFSRVLVKGIALFYVAMLLILLIIHTCSSLTILKSKQIIELKYQAGHETALKDLELQQPGRLTVEKLQQHFIGSLVGTIAPLCRCYAALSFKLSIEWIWSHIKVFKVESYWTQKLYDWKQSSIPFSVGSRKIKIVIQNFKVIFLIICIGLQMTVVVACKMIALIPIFFVICGLFCIWCWKWFKAMFSASSIFKRQNPKAMFSASSIVERQNPEQQENFNDLRRYVLQLQDDMELSKRTLKSISKSVNRLIKKAEKQQPSNLVELLRESKGFEGVGKHDSLHVPPLFAQDYPDCWSLPLVTLTAITVSLPQIQNERVDRLLSSVSKGLTYVTLVEESFNATDEYVSIQKAAKVLWLEVEVSNTWVGINLKNHAPEVNTAGLILQWFKNTAKNMVNEVQVIDNKSANDNSIYRSVCANSMYRITESILFSYHTNIDELSQEDLFTGLSSMIADILAACLTNLPQVIVTKCHESVIEKRESSVNATVQLLGETTQIINNLQDRELPDLNPAELPFIDKWRDYFNSLSP